MNNSIKHRCSALCAFCYPHRTHTEIFSFVITGRSSSSSSKPDMSTMDGKRRAIGRRERVSETLYKYGICIYDFMPKPARYFHINIYMKYIGGLAGWPYMERPQCASAHRPQRKLMIAHFRLAARENFNHANAEECDGVLLCASASIVKRAKMPLCNIVHMRYAFISYDDRNVFIVSLLYHSLSFSLALIFSHGSASATWACARTTKWQIFSYEQIMLQFRTKCRWVQCEYGRITVIACQSPSVAGNIVCYAQLYIAAFIEVSKAFAHRLWCLLRFHMQFPPPKQHPY